MIFLDNASTTKMYDGAFEELKKFSLEHYFNPSALYAGGVLVHKELENARNTISTYLGCTADHLIFTSSATEAISLAVNGSIQSNFKEIVVSEIEHPAMFNTVKSLKNKGMQIKYLKTDTDGTVSIESVRQVVNRETNMLCVMLVNNETGAVNNVRDIVRLAKSINPNIITICDCVQAFCKIPFKVKQLDVDFAIISAHKIHGPKGVGALYCKNLNKLKPQILGGGQERGFRNGTENTAGILAFAKAAEIKYSNLQQDFKHVQLLKDKVINCLSKIDDVKINSNATSSPYILNFSVKGLKAEVILHMLEQFDIYVGNGSACSARHQDNRILKSMGVQQEYVNGSLRVSFCSFNTMQEIEYFCEKLIFCINQLRNVIENI